MIQSTRVLKDTSQAQTRYRLDTNNNHRADANEPVIVQRTKDGWEPTQKVDQVHRFAMEKSFGVWTDKQVSHKEGWFWDRKEVVDRPLDGKIDADEVAAPAFRRLGNGLYGSSNSFELGSELLRDQDGALFLDEHSVTYGSRRIIGKGDIQSMEAYRQDDSNWYVSKNTPLLMGSTDGPIHLGGGSVTVTIPITGPKN
jgi:hypothetical protein